LLIYLDNCCYNRPFDEQAQVRVRLETEAKMRLQSLMRGGEIGYAWSSVLEYEIGRSPFFDRVKKIRPWRCGATTYVRLDELLIARGAEIMSLGVKKMDALHLACAEHAGCEWFFTFDRGILKKVRNLGAMRVANPVEFVLEEMP